MVVVETDRLVLRPWKKSDLAPFAQMNADPKVMEHFPAVLTRAQSDALADKFERKLEAQGYGFWACERKDTGEFIGFVGLNDVPFEAEFTPAVEIGWRLDPAHWGQGFATEAAKACLDYAFNEAKLPEVVSFTSLNNVRSQWVMERLGMAHDQADDFDHPLLDTDHPLCRHVLYRIKNPS